MKKNLFLNRHCRLAFPSFLYLFFIFSVIFLSVNSFLESSFYQAEEITEKNDYQNDYQRAENYYKTSKYDDAIAYYYLSLEKFPRNEFAYIGLSKTFYKKKKYEDAIEFAKGVVERNSSNKGTKIYRLGQSALARAYIESNRLEEAKGILDFLYKRYPRDTEVLFSLSLYYEKLSDPRLSTKYLNEIQALDPKHLDSLFSLMRIAISHKDQAAAEKYLRRAELLAPDHIDLYEAFLYFYTSLSIANQRGNAREQQIYLAKAIEFIKILQKKQPDNMEYLKKLIMLEYLSKAPKKMSEALDALQSRSAANNSREQAFISSFRSYLTNDPAESIALKKASIELEPNNSFLREAYNQALLAATSKNFSTKGGGGNSLANSFFSERNALARYYQRKMQKEKQIYKYRLAALYLDKALALNAPSPSLAKEGIDMAYEKGDIEVFLYRLRQAYKLAPISQKAKMNHRLSTALDNKYKYLPYHAKLFNPYMSPEKGNFKRFSQNILCLNIVPKKQNLIYEQFYFPLILRDALCSSLRAPAPLRSLPKQVSQYIYSSLEKQGQSGPFNFYSPRTSIAIERFSRSVPKNILNNLKQFEKPIRIDFLLLGSYSYKEKKNGNRQNQLYLDLSLISMKTKRRVVSIRFTVKGDDLLSSAALALKDYLKKASFSTGNRKAAIKIHARIEKVTKEGEIYINIGKVDTLTKMDRMGIRGVSPKIAFLRPKKISNYFSQVEFINPSKVNTDAFKKALEIKGRIEDGENLGLRVLR